MSSRRIVVLLFCSCLVVVNAPLAVYRAWTDHVTPYGYNGRTFHVLEAVVNVVLGVAGVWWAVRRKPRRTADSDAAIDRQPVK